MKKITSKCGHIAYSVTAKELGKIGGLGICDYCNQFDEEGFLIPVLNRFYCRKCYPGWEERAEYYAEDEPFELDTAQYYESIIGLDEEGETNG